jgi:hypothetical protein
MHPEISRTIAAERTAEFQRTAEFHRAARLQRLAARCRRRESRPFTRPRPLTRVRLVAARLPMVRLLVARLTPARPGRAQAAARGALPGVFAAGPEAFGMRIYLTAAEARQLAADWAGLLAGFADRVDDPSRRPADAVPFELVVLGRQVPDLVGAARGLPGPEGAG